MFPFHSVNKKGTIARNGLKYPGSILTKVRSSKRKCSMIKADLKNFAIFTIFAGLQACIFIKKRLQHRCFPVNIENTYSANDCCERLLLLLSQIHQLLFWKKQDLSNKSFLHEFIFMISLAFPLYDRWF